MTQNQKTTLDWILKQTPLATVLIFITIFQYKYFTSELDKRDIKIEKLENKIDMLQHEIFINNIKNEKYKT